jgi:hypothetical protein
MEALLKLELGINSAFVDIAIADSLRLVRSEELWFNGGRFAFTTADGVYQYPLPKDFLGIRGKVYCIVGGSTSNGVKALQPSTPDEAEELLYMGIDYDTTQTTGVAGRYAVDLLDKVLLIAPIPSTSADLISLKYTKDLGTPNYTVSASSSTPPSVSPTVTLTGPDNQTIPATFTNAWFDEGFKLIKERASHELYSRFHGGTEESMAKAQGALLRYLEELRKLRSETAVQASNVRVRRHF